MNLTGKILLEAAAALYRDRLVIARRLLWPVGLVLLSYFLSFITPFVFVRSLGISESAAGSIISWLVTAVLAGGVVCFVMAWCLCAIVIHRSILLGVHSVDAYSLFWTRRETWFVLHFLALGLFVLPFYLLNFVPEVGSVLAWAVIAYIGSRLSLVFPGIAIGRGVSFRLSWQLTRRYQLLAFLVVGVVPWLLNYLFSLAMIGYYMIPVAIVVDIVVGLYAFSALSLLYKEVIEQEYGSPPVGGLSETRALKDV